jgi:hypothetical protein
MTDPNPEPTVAEPDDEEERAAYEAEVADGLYDAWSDEDWQAWEDALASEAPLLADVLRRSGVLGPARLVAGLANELRDLHEEKDA